MHPCSISSAIYLIMMITSSQLMYCLVLLPPQKIFTFPNPKMVKKIGRIFIAIGGSSLKKMH
jgi:hypothetical protein